MARALWNGVVIAESDHTVVVEGNHYFPRSALSDSLIEPSDTTTHCPWKGTASYYSLVVNGQRNTDAVWYYAAPHDAAQEIEGHVAFWRGVTIEA